MNTKFEHSEEDVDLLQAIAEDLGVKIKPCNTHPEIWY